MNQGKINTSEPQKFVLINSLQRLSNNPPIHIYINRIDNRLLFKLWDGYKLELQTPETMKLFGRSKKLIDKTKNGKNTPNFENFEIVLVQHNLVDNQYQQKSEVWHTFKSNKSRAYLLNVEPSILVFSKTNNTELDDFIITFTNQNGRPLGIKGKVSLTLRINK